MILLCILASAEDGTIPNLGHLYNCEVTKYKGLYAIPDPLQCIKSSQLNDIHNFEAQIKQYSPRITRMSVFHCVLSRVNAICSEDNLWKANYKMEYPTVPITHEECWRAWKYKAFRGKRMLKHGAKAWKSTQTAHYDCRFDQT